MKSYIVNTSFHIPSGIEKKFLKWAKEEFIPSALKESYFSNPLFCKLMITVEEGTVSYAIHFRTNDIEAAEKWQNSEGAKLKIMFPPDSLLHFTTYMEEIEII